MDQEKLRASQCKGSIKANQTTKAAGDQYMVRINSFGIREFQHWPK